MFENDEEEMKFIKEQDENIQAHIRNIEMNLDALKGNSTVTLSDYKTTHVLSQLELANEIALDAKAIKDAILLQ